MSLLGYFWLFNILNILDGLSTIWGIESGIFREVNWVVIFYIKKLGLYWGMFFVKLVAFLLSLTMYHFKTRLGLILITIFYALIVSYQVILMIHYAALP